VATIGRVAEDSKANVKVVQGQRGILRHLGGTGSDREQRDDARGLRGIPFDEEKMRRQFGWSFDAYAGKIRRWI
jgi:hypothetical protein